MSYREGRFWQPDVTVATIVVRDGRLLVVEERVDGRLVLNQPAGHLEPDESLVEAALRETREETGWDVRLTGFVGAYQWKAETGRHYLRFAFCAEPERHDPERKLDTGEALPTDATKGDEEEGEVLDLMEALRRSVERNRGKGAKRTKPAAKGSSPSKKPTAKGSSPSKKPAAKKRKAG